jgi:transcription antitermination factor NusB
MLNRRFLRVKALQSLYAFEQAKYADFQLAKDLIVETYEPDWDQKANADWALLRKQRQESTQLFAKYHEDSADLVTLEVEPKVKKVAFEAINHYRNSVQKDKTHYLRTSLNQADKMYDIYLSILLLIIELADLAATEKENLKSSFIRKDQVTGDFKLAQNQICQTLRKHPVFQNEIAKHNISWQEQIELLQDLYRKSLKIDPVYQKYDQKPKSDLETDREIILHILREIVFNQRIINSFSISEIYLDMSAYLTLYKFYTFVETSDILFNALEPAFDSFLNMLNLNVNEADANKKALFEQYRTLSKDLQSTKFQSSEKTAAIRAKEPDEEIPTELHQEANRQKVEKLITKTLDLLVESFSAYLAKNKLHLASEQNINLDAINHALARFLEKAGINWGSENKITLQVKVEQVSIGINEYFAENDLNWAEDNKIIQSMVQKTIKSISSMDDAQFELISLSRNWEDDKAFFQELLKKTIENDKEYEAYIAEKAKNWDMSRLALIDKAILKMAICEMITFYSIPVKVTINEYIELAKTYSTPKSKQFVNGLLDAISQNLIERKIIKKSGRGLMDNK